MADQFDAAFRAAEGYSSLASSFHPELRDRVSELVNRPRTFAYPEVYADLLPPVLAFAAHLHELSVRVATDGPAAPYLVWAMHPEVNWAVPTGYTPAGIARVLMARCWLERCNWCKKTEPEPSEGLLVSAGCAVALFSVCAFCRIAFDLECTADQYWL